MPVKYNSFQPCTYTGLNYKTPLRSVVDLWANISIKMQDLPFKLTRKSRVESSFQDGCYSSLLSSSVSRRNLLDVVRTALVELGMFLGVAFQRQQTLRPIALDGLGFVLLRDVGSLPSSLDQRPYIFVFMLRRSSPLLRIIGDFPTIRSLTTSTDAFAILDCCEREATGR